MSPISNDTARSLDRLNDQIAEAEDYLSRFPGSRHRNCFVIIDDSHSGATLLQFCHHEDLDPDDECLCVKQHDRLDQVVSSEMLVNLPISKRIAVARLIPDLIERAQSAESLVADDAAEVADTIEQALAKWSKG